MNSLPFVTSTFVTLPNVGAVFTSECSGSDWRSLLPATERHTKRAGETLSAIAPLRKVMAGRCSTGFVGHDDERYGGRPRGVGEFQQ